MKKYKGYLILGLAVVAYFFMVSTSNKQTDWNEHYDSKSTSPYGTKALIELLQDKPFGVGVTHTRKTFYEIWNEESVTDLMVIADKFFAGDEDRNSIIEVAELGGNILLAAEKIDARTADTLGLELEYEYSDIYRVPEINENNISDIDTTYLQAGDLKGYYSDFDLSFYIAKYDKETSTVLATNERGQAIYVKVKVGEGNVYVLTTPKVFANINLLYEDNHYLVAKILSELPQGEYVRSELYTLGRGLSSSPFRYLVSQNALKWGFYILLLTLVIFMIFESRRKQRIIPVIEPPANMSLSHLNTLTQLYLKKGENSNLLEKRKVYFFDVLRKRFFIDPINTQQDQLVEALSIKTGLGVKVLNKLIDSLEMATTNPTDDKFFFDVNRQLDSFYQHINS
ncbi:DUF4350 domain-containing protein [Limibacter armeniacum]|uniref:DUF4350 domain-containing protein n=1 Tax=Limibacter armeniacum TaxID=466084 RepID=UPI002FE675DC